MASDTTIGYLPQDGIVHHGRTVYDEVVLAFEELLRLKEEQHRIEEKLSEATHDDGGDHERAARAVRRGHRALQAPRRLRDRRPRGRRPEGPRLHAGRPAAADRGVLRRLADAHRAGQAAAGPPQPAAPRRAHQPPRPARAQLARGVHVTSTRARSCSSPTTATSSTPPSSASPRSACARSPTTTATTRSTWSSTRRAWRTCARRTAGRRKRSRSRTPSSTSSATGHQGAPGAEPHQDAGQGRRHRDPARAQEDPLQVPRRAQARARGGRAEGRPAQPTATTSSSTDVNLLVERGDRDRAGRPQRRRQVDADADPRRRGPSRRRRARPRPQRGHRLLRPGPGRGAHHHAHRLRGDDVGQPDHHGADDPQHPGRLPVLGRRRLQEGGRALGRRAQPARAGQDAAERRATSCCSTSRPTTSTSTPRKSCWRRWPTTAAR